jgi:hypothetical protein
VGWSSKFRSTWGVQFWGLLLIAASFLVLQLYSVRELLAAELIFALVFLSLAALGAALYFLGAIVERGPHKTQTRLQAVPEFLRRGYNGLEVSRRWFHNVHAIHAHK